MTRLSLLGASLLWAQPLQAAPPEAAAPRSATPQSAAPPSAAIARAKPPAWIASNIKPDGFEPGDYSWLRGIFLDASPADKARLGELRAYQDACTAAENGRIRRELAAMGVTAAKLEPAPYGDRVCGETMGLWLDKADYASWPAFQTALAQARPIAATLIWTADLAGRRVGARDDTLAERLRARPTIEQMLRISLSWGQGDAAGAPTLPPLVLQVVKALISREVDARDHANTAWLKEIVSAQGWPRMSVVGKPAANSAWLLAQHADNDPVFQLRVLRLMEPLVAKGEADKGDYAYLYDRVMLKIVGTQRYATQFWCKDGKFEPQPLQDSAGVERHRKDMGLQTLAEYRKMFDGMYGASRC